MSPEFTNIDHESDLVTLTMLCTEQILRNPNTHIIPPGHYSLPSSYNLELFSASSQEGVKGVIANLTHYLDFPIITDTFSSDLARNSHERMLRSTIALNLGEPAAEVYSLIINQNKVKGNAISSVQMSAHTLSRYGQIANFNPKPLSTLLETTKQQFQAHLYDPLPPQEKIKIAENISDAICDCLWVYQAV